MARALLTQKAALQEIERKAGELNSLRRNGELPCLSMSSEQSGGDVFRVEVATALRAVGEECKKMGTSGKDVTVGDVLKAVESLRTKRLAAATDKRCAGEIVREGRNETPSASDSHSDFFRKLTQRNKDREEDPDWLRKAVARREVQNTFTLRDAEGLNQAQWTGYTQHVPIRESSQILWKSEVDHSVNAMYTAGDCLFAGLGSGRIAILSPEGDLRMTLVGHTGYVSSLTGSGQVLFSGSLDGTIRLWVYYKGEQMALSAGHTGPVHCLHYDANYKILYSGSSDQCIRAWNLTEGKSQVLTNFERNKGDRKESEGVFALTEGVKNVLVAGLESGNVAFIDKNSGIVTRVLEGHTDLVASVDVHHESRTCVSGSRDNTCRVWFAGHTNLSYTKHKGPIYKVQIVDDGKMCISLSGDQSVHRWNLVDGSTHCIFLGHTATIFSYTFCHGKMYTADRNCEVLMWNANVQCEFCIPKCGLGCRWRSVRCPNDGCDVKCSELDIHKHMPECQKRILKCRNKDCPMKICFDALTSHMNKECQFSYIGCPNSAFCVDRVQRKHLQSHLQSCRPPVAVTPKILEEAAAMDAVVDQPSPIAVNNVAPVAKKTIVIKKKKALLPKVTLRKVSLPKKPKAEVRVWRPGFKKD
jgi:hypothetical protein